ncbi:hypothetical protein [Asticcacaulis sp. YBE204]|uniref:hypothetical protein n=1 Tax=Asticcacaulis sp. YBE204 TaxID=1282363 RepID=UPI0003C3AD72|nr:hypothetical protein [Asticcacaulis sp. YBE204]ESQ78586.1 hypothetical protein AEYBE204_13630 [Asticcacaulis sp. YBE204]
MTSGLKITATTLVLALLFGFLGFSFIVPVDDPSLPVELAGYRARTEQDCVMMSLVYHQSYAGLGLLPRWLSCKVVTIEGETVYRSRHYPEMNRETLPTVEGTTIISPYVNLPTHDDATHAHLSIGNPSGDGESGIGERCDLVRTLGFWRVHKCEQIWRS